MRKNEIVLILFILITFCGCIPPQLPLSKGEKLLETKLSKDFGCLVDFKHDYPNIKNGGSNGSFGVFMCDNMCDIEHSELLKICIKISIQVSNILSHKNSYKSITIGFSRTLKLSDKIERGVCSKYFEFSVSKPDSLLYFRK
jgi:hypothetical protein